ncbi:UDP-N-acetylmuramate dehydrogenase [Candidatus Poribacteria bacterium]|nr:UDP-N-acetylmuramate dehydrogenase [Candidatus Poribacteria bacterium]
MPPSPYLRDPGLRSIRGLKLIPGADLSDRTSMKTQAAAAMLVVVESPLALRQLLQLVRSREWPLMILGGGTNTIFATAWFDGIVAVLSGEMFGQIEQVGERTLRVGAAADLQELLNKSVKKFGLMGLEFCTGIPGTTGGALAGNAGAGNWGLCDFVDRVMWMTRDGRIHNLQRNGFWYGYRNSDLSEGIVLEADLRLEPLDSAVQAAARRDFASKKKGQPFHLPSSGCIFKNPRDPRTGQKVSAGMLIDRAGLKGYSLNSVTVSEGHANFLVNMGGASGEDFLAMISLIQDVVLEVHGVELELEAKIVGGPLTSCVMG